MRRISVILCALIVLLSSTSIAQARRTRSVCVTPHMQRSFIINQPYEVVLGAIIRNGLDNVGQSIGGKLEILEHDWDKIELHCNLKKSTFSGKGDGNLRVKIADRRIGTITCWIHADVQVSNTSSRIVLTLLNRVCVQGHSVHGYQTDIQLSAHGKQTMVKTRLYLKVWTNVPACIFRRIVNNIAHNTACQINCQMQRETEAVIRSAVKSHKDEVTLLPLVMAALKESASLPVDFEEATVIVKRDEEGNFIPDITTK